jgi:signal transduction histidine kinase
MMFQFSVNAQDPIENIDSLIEVFSHHRTYDTTRVNLLNDIAYAYVPLILDGDSSKLELARRYVQESVVLGEKLHYKTGTARAYNVTGIICFLSDQSYEAYSYYKKAEKIYTELADTLRLCYINNNIIMTLQKLGEVETLRTQVYHLLDLSMKIGNVRFIADAVNALVNSGEGSEKITEGIRYAIARLDEVRPTSRAVLERSYGEVLAKQKKKDEALEYVHRARVRDEKDSVDLRWVYITLAQIHVIFENVDSAKYYLDKVHGLSGENSLNHNYYIEHVSMKIDSLKGNCWGAFLHFRKSVEIDDSIAKKAKIDEIVSIKNWHKIEQRRAEEQIILQEKRNQEKLNFLLYILLVLILMLVVMLVIYYKKRVNDNKLLQRNNEELQELHGVKDKLFSLIAHDLRNPMISFMSMIKLFSLREVGPEEQDEMLEDISNKANETYSLLNNLLYWSKSQMNGISPQPGYFDIRERSNESIRSLEHQALYKGIVLYNAITSLQVWADPDMTDVVFRNLITNAVKYSQSGDIVTIASAVKGDFVEISVKDTGIGISPETQQKLFNISETTSQRGTTNESGSGLGLVLSADFVRLNGGTIWFESELGKGSTFYFTIPLHP